MKVKIDNPAFPEGHELAIDGLGVFKNGEEQDIDDEQMAAFKVATGKELAEAFGIDDTVYINGKAGEPVKYDEEGQPTTEEAPPVVEEAPVEEGVSE